MAVETHYYGPGGAEDLYMDAEVHSVAVSSSVNSNKTGLAAYLLRLDGTGDTGTGDWLTTGKMTASYFVASSASDYSTLPRLLASTTLRVVGASTFEVDASSLDCAVAANFTAAVAMTGGATSNTLVVGTDPTGAQVLRAASARFTTLEVAGNTNLQAALTVTSGVGIGGNVNLGGTLAVTGATTHTGAVALNGGATVPSGQTMTIASGATLTVSGTMSITTFTASTATIAGASGGSEALRTTTFRATGASVMVGGVTMSSTLTVASTATLASVSCTGEASVTSAGGFTNEGTANYFALPDTADTGAGTSLDLDALSTKNSHLFNPTSGARSITSISGTRKGVYWLVNTHASNAVTFADALVTYPTGATFVLSANSTALVYWDNSALSVICKYS